MSGLMSANSLQSTPISPASLLLQRTQRALARRRGALRVHHDRCSARQELVAFPLGCSGFGHPWLRRAPDRVACTGRLQARSVASAAIISRLPQIRPWRTSSAEIAFEHARYAARCTGSTRRVRASLPVRRDASLGSTAGARVGCLRPEQTAQDAVGGGRTATAGVSTPRRRRRALRSISADSVFAGAHRTSRRSLPSAAHVSASRITASSRGS